MSSEWALTRSLLLLQTQKRVRILTFFNAQIRKIVIELIKNVTGGIAWTGALYCPAIVISSVSSYQTSLNNELGRNKARADLLQSDPYQTDTRAGLPQPHTTLI